MVKGVITGKKKSKKYRKRCVKKVIAINKQAIIRSVTKAIASKVLNSGVIWGRCEYRREIPKAIATPKVKQTK
ncbi:hypothetical protein M0D70_10175 [Acinetobacter portensis]|uniref:Uncharacterized protein n=2 Tax=Acinetobacter TaxID=469 RepID=A0AB35UV23_9GAMM|nr:MULTISPECIES: hypothetical protein [Acinetobacter]MCK7609748.1 hypothetical protein [Acinetobacter portensis]MCK7640522.1 hypothetical protein [Acinetobacter portensis]MDY6456761.1 hypothetical protein [Acinetobacter faecalis]MDY6460198.1 hypothetical protein [Acinetobacter faecalis]MDY6462669.1 hypothetical protein [Acinetobacter faecalis]